MLGVKDVKGVKSAYGVLLCCGVLVGSVGGILSIESEARAVSSSKLMGDHVARFISPYPHSQFYPMGSELHVDGKPRELAYALSEDSPEIVADWYEGIWETQGLLVRRRRLGGEVIVTGSDPIGGWVRTIVATTHREELIGPVGFRDDRKTVLIASLSEAFEVPVAPSVPVPDFCEVKSYTGARDLGVHTEMVFLRCEASLREVTGFYDREFPEAKRREPLEFGPGSSSAHLTFDTPTSGLVLTAVKLARDTPGVAVTLTWQER